MALGDYLKRGNIGLVGSAYGGSIGGLGTAYMSGNNEFSPIEPLEGLDERTYNIKRTNTPFSKLRNQAIRKNERESLRKMQINAARQLFQQGDPQYAAPSPLLDTFSQLVQDRISQDPWQTIQPQLNEAYQRAVASVPSQVQAQFARYGRSGSGLADQAVAEGIANQFAQAATPLIESEKARQQQLMFALPGIGQQYQQYQQQLLDAPYTRIQQLASLRPGPRGYPSMGSTGGGTGFGSALLSGAGAGLAAAAMPGVGLPLALGTGAVGALSGLL